jgi:FtsZ-binding cell division protein ZapB
MTDELIKSLEDLHNRLVLNYNDNIPFEQYEEDRLDVDNAIDTINRQQSAIDVYMQENDRLKTAYIQVSENRNEIRKEAEAEIDELKRERDVMLEDLQFRSSQVIEQQAEIEEWKKINQRLYDEMKERRKEDIGIAKGYARIKAIKEYRERLKKWLKDDVTLFTQQRYIMEGAIEKAYEEMVGEQE